MSIITNDPTGTVVSSTAYNNPLLDALKRMTIDDSVLPCIRSGLQVTPGSGLTVNISAGSARGQYITFTQLNLPSGNTQSLPTDVILPAVSGLSVPDNSTGWIVLNVNISPDPTSIGSTYQIEADNDTGPTPTVTPVFVDTLSPNPESSYPYTQIVLATVITVSGAVTDIESSFGLGNRSYDFSQALTGGDPGDMLMSYGNKKVAYWVPMNDGSIGSASSGATTLASAIAYNLYRQLWSTISNVWCPVSGGRGASAFADFYANKPMLLPATVGRALCNSGTATLNMVFTAAGNILTVPTTSSLYNGTPVTVSNTGGALPSPLVAATTYYVVNLSGTTVSLATTRLNVNNAGGAPIVITLTTSGSGVNTITVDYSAYVSGQIIGENGHQLIGSEEAAHIHDDNGEIVGVPLGGSNIVTRDGPTVTPVFPNVGDTPHNNMQPSSFIPVYAHI